MLLQILRGFAIGLVGGSISGLIFGRIYFKRWIWQSIMEGRKAGKAIDRIKEEIEKLEAKNKRSSAFTDHKGKINVLMNIPGVEAGVNGALSAITGILEGLKEKGLPPEEMSGRSVYVSILGMLSAMGMSLSAFRLGVPVESIMKKIDAVGAGEMTPEMAERIYHELEAEAKLTKDVKVTQQWGDC